MGVLLIVATWLSLFTVFITVGITVTIIVRLLSKTLK